MPVSDEGHFGVQVWAKPGCCAAFHLETFRDGESGLEIFSQIVSERKFVEGAAVDARKPICYKNASRPAHSLWKLCEGAYSAVAQWQSIRLLTEGL